MTYDKAEEVWLALTKCEPSQEISLIAAYGAKCRARGIEEMRDAAMDCLVPDIWHEGDCGKIKAEAARLLSSVPSEAPGILTKVPMPEGEYYRCAVCEGRGHIHRDEGNETAANDVPCHACGSVGQLWRPFSEASDKLAGLVELLIERALREISELLTDPPSVELILRRDDIQRFVADMHALAALEASR